jgi:hypothetical protein
MSPKDQSAFITKHGGASAVARKCGVSKSTAFRWKSGECKMPEVAIRLLNKG